MQNKERYENLEKFIPLTVGKFDIPAIKADDVVYSDFIGFNYAKTYKTPKDKAVHFFLTITSLRGFGISQMTT